VKASRTVRSAIQPITKLAPIKSGTARKLIGTICPRSEKRSAASGRAESLRCYLEVFRFPDEFRFMSTPGMICVTGA
jgi:hypothetical protein